MAALSSRQISAARSARHRASSATMVVHGRRRDDGRAAEVAVVASRAVGNAVARNRAKRRLRAAARQARLPVSVDLVIDARPATVDAPFTVLEHDLARLSARVEQRAQR